MVHSTAQQTELSIDPVHLRDMRKASRKIFSKRIHLNKTQQDILLYLERGLSKEEAANKLGINVHTFDAYLRGIYSSIGVHTMVAAVAKAIRDGMI